MTTRFIGIKELRQNMAQITQRSSKKKERLIVLRKNEPLFELRPLSGKDVFENRLLVNLKVAEVDAKKGKSSSLVDVAQRLGLD